MKKKIHWNIFLIFYSIGILIVVLSSYSLPFINSIFLFIGVLGILYAGYNLGKVL